VTKTRNWDLKVSIGGLCSVTRLHETLLKRASKICEKKRKIRRKKERK